MSLFKQSRMPLPTGQNQRVHECLVRYGLVRTQEKHRASYEGTSAYPPCSSLRLALQELGELYCLFGLYLSTRIDLFSPEDCEELSRIPDRAQPSGFADVQEFVEQELGVGIDQAFLAVEPEPYETSLLRDSYIAMLHSGENVLLHVLRREFRSFPVEEIDILRTLGSIRFFEHWPARVVSDVFVDFTRELRLRIDLSQDADAYKALGFDANVADGLWSPRIIHEFCRPRILATEKRPSAKLSVVISTNARFNDNRAFQEAGKPSSEKLARLLCLAWLRQVFHGRVFPVQFTADDVFLSDDGNVAFLGSAFSTTPTDIKDSIWKYLLALAADNPDECCRTLLSLMHKHKERVSSQELLASFRQAVTCFMSGPGKQDFYTGLAARVLRHLQLATEAGYHPLPALLAFYRGLFSALAIARALQPTGDPLLEAVEGVWVLGIFGSASQMIRIDSLSDISSKYAAAIFDFPTRLDAMLSQALRKKSDEAIEPATASAQDNTPAYSVAIVLLLTAVLLLVRNGPIHFSSAWIDGVSFVICCLIGLLVLRMAARS